jgi:hypothetical protein
LPSPHAPCTQVAQLCRFLQAAGDMVIEGDNESLGKFSSADKIEGHDPAPLTSKKSPCGSPKSRSHSQMARDMQRELSEMLLKLPGDPNLSVCSHRVLLLLFSPRLRVMRANLCVCGRRHVPGICVCARRTPASS